MALFKGSNEKVRKMMTSQNSIEKKKKRKTGLVLATTLHFHDTSKNKLGWGLVSLSWNKEQVIEVDRMGTTRANTAKVHTSLFSRTCFGRIPWKNCGGEWDKTLGRWNKSPTRQELVVTLPRDCCSQTSCHTNRLVHEGALQIRQKNYHKVETTRKHKSAQITYLGLWGSVAPDSTPTWSWLWARWTHFSVDLCGKGVGEGERIFFEADHLSH